jgi:hypothetical protein
MSELRTIPLYLSADEPFTLTVFCGDGDRFARLFTETWFKLPPTARTSILTHWKQEENPIIWMEFSNAWRNCATRYAEIGCRGCELNFDADEFDGMPEAVAKAVIAHELAHAYQYATGRDQAVDLESDAEDSIRQWGFDWVTKIQWKAKRQRAATV